MHVILIFFHLYLIYYFYSLKIFLHPFLSTEIKAFFLKFYTFTLTSYLVLPLFFSFIVLGSCVFVGLQQRGLRFFSLFHPTAPKLILNFLIIIELISYVTRLFSLSIRLFANMVAGHALLKILLSFI